MSGPAACVETIRSGDHYFLLDKKDIVRDAASRLGPVAIWSVEEYKERYPKARTDKDPTHMFAHPDKHASFDEGEMAAYADYLQHPSNVLAELNDGDAVVAYENPALRTYAVEPRVTEPVPVK